MENGEKDVSVDSSSTEVEEQQLQEETVIQVSEPEIEQQDVIPLPVHGEEDVDEKGVPYKNRFHEVSRKLDKIQEEIPNLIQQAVQQASQPKYTKSELEEFLSSEQGQDPVNKRWAQEKINELTKVELLETVRNELRAEKQKEYNVMRQRQAFQQAAQLCPDAFVVQNGVPVGLNPKSKTAPLIDSILRARPEIASLPDGVAIAAQMARGHLASLEAQQNAKKAQMLEGEKGALQRSTLTSSGDSEAKFDATSQAYERFTKSGKRDDYLAYLKLRRKTGE
jgi:hypothetical protein